MKKVLLFILVIQIGFAGASFAQKITGTKGNATKHATVKIADIEQVKGDGQIKYKKPNPHWKPPQWDYNKDNVIYKQSVLPKSASPGKTREVSPMPTKSFAGLKDNGTSIPPDVNGAAGPNHIMQTLNTEVRISDKDGTPLYTTTLSSFWSSLPGSGSTFDPKIVYDQYTERWIMTTPSGSGVNSKIYFGVSLTSDPLGEWHMYWFDPDETNATWFDYPNLGFNKNWISVGGIQRNAAFEAVDYVVFAIDKLAALNGDDAPAVSRFTTTIGSAIVPAFTYDEDVEELYLISTGDGNDDGYGYVNLFELSGEIENPDFTLLGSVGVAEPWENWSYENHGDFLPQKGTNNLLNSVDARMHTMIYRNNKLWAVHHIYLPADDPERTSIQWWQFDTDGVILERGRIDDPENEMSFAYPSIAVNADEDIFIGHGVFSTNQYAGAGYSFKDFSDDSAAMRNYYEYQAGKAPYTKTFGGDRNRWGDYSAVFVDPVNDIDFWAMHEYAETPAGSDQWGTWWAQISIFPPVADFQANEVLIPTGESVNFTDLSTGVPDSWSWEFTGGTPSTSNEQNPTGITYDTEGVFDVQLITSNNFGVDTILKVGYITSSTTLLPDVDFEADKMVICSGDAVKFTDLTSYSPIQWEWTFDPPTVSFINGTAAESQNPEVTFDNLGKYDVKLKSWNSNGSSELTQMEMIVAGGYAPFYKETFETETFLSEEWKIENPDSDVTWEYYDVGGTVPGDMAAGIDLANYFFIGERDRLISPPINLEGMTSAVLEFQHAYAQRNTNMTDSLIVYISADCGTTWTKILSSGEDGNGSLATHEPMNGDFWPEITEDWCMSGWGASCYALDLSSWVGQADLKIAFETYSGFGNPMFIDNVTVSQFVGQNEHLTETDDFIIYPNPTTGSFTIEISNPQNFDRISMVNHLGQHMYHTQLDGNTQRIVLEKQTDWKPGIYFIRLSGKTKNALQKLIIY